MKAGEDLLDLVEAHLGALAAPGGALPGFRLPGLLLGQPVGADVRADLLFTLARLHDAGRRSLATPEVGRALLAGVDGPATHTFFSYRVAEAAAAFGLDGLTPEQRASVESATDSADWVALLDRGVLPRNYAAVLARCAWMRRALGLDAPELGDLLDRTRSILGGHLDDSNAGIGRYDVYTADVHLFCTPMVGELGPAWVDGARAALDLVDRVAATDGSAVTWGRSTGVLSVCHTIELGALTVSHPDLLAGPDDGPRRRWLARAAHAAGRVGASFSHGWVNAHQHRLSDSYRGLPRRLQLTLDCLGKLAEAGAVLAAADEPAEVELFPDRDELVRFGDATAASVWAYRSSATAFVVPLVGATTSGYLAGPRNPGLFEVPATDDLPAWTPVVQRGLARYAAGVVPTAVEHGTGQLTARFDGFAETGRLEPGTVEPLPGSREVTWRVEGRTLVVDEHLCFDADHLPDAVALQVTEAESRPLAVAFEASGPATTAVLDVDGIAEFRSQWGELPRTHQVDIEPAPAMRLRWSVTPLVRVASTAHGNPYSDGLYAPLADRVRVGPLPHSAAVSPVRLRELASRTDVLHLHWPEWVLPLEVDQHRRLADGLLAAGTRIAWTQHNLEPHLKDPAAGPVWEVWAAAADLVLHHSEWGRSRCEATYRYADGARHVVVPHPAWTSTVGAGSAERAAIRVEVEAEMGLRPGALRLGIVGAPRVEKDVAMAMRAVARSGRDDIELLVLSLDGEAVPADPRIVALPYSMVDRTTYDRRLAALDAVLLPFEPSGAMLTTGTVGDIVAHGMAAVTSSWPYLVEVLGDAGIVYGSTEDDLVACLETLDAAALASAAVASVALRAPLSWTSIAERLYVELDRMGGAHT